MKNDRFTIYAAVYLLLIWDGKILLLRRFNTGWQDGKYSLVAGHLDGGESVTQAMVREAYEEAGVRILPEHLQVIHVMHRNSPDREYIDFFLAAQSWDGKPHIMEADKCDDLRWFALESLPKNILPYVKKAIHYYRAGVFYSEFGWKTE